MRPEGLRAQSEAVCETLATIRKSDIGATPIDALSQSRFAELDRAIARALDIRRHNLPLA